MPRPETCQTCGEEVRYGYREGWGWFHREMAAHNPLFGVPQSRESFYETLEAIRSRTAGQTVKGEGDIDIKEDILQVTHEPTIAWMEVEPDDDLVIPTGGACQIARQLAKGPHVWRMSYAYAWWKGNSVSDMVRLEVDTGPVRGVAFWRDDKFYSAYRSDTLGGISSTEFKKLLKEEPS